MLLYSILVGVWRDGIVLGKEEVVSSNLTNSSGESLQEQAFLKYSKWRYRLGVRT